MVVRPLLERLRRPWLRARRKVPVELFDATTGQWRPAHAALAPRQVGRDELVLTTFNIWYDPYFATARWRAIGALLAGHEPDVMAFQEVTPEALDVLRAQPWIRDRYGCAAMTGSDVGNYGLLLLSRLPMSGVEYTRLPSRLDRGVLRAEVTIGARRIVVCCVHLDSGKTAARLRGRQLDRIVRSVRPADDAVLIGDFNMRASEDWRIEPPFTDVWPRLRPGEPGYTEDTTINSMRLDHKGKQRHVRFDRVLLKGSAWSATEIDLLGTEPESREHPRVFPSDHFGVRCRLEPRPRQNLP